MNAFEFIYVFEERRRRKKIERKKKERKKKKIFVSMKCDFKNVCLARNCVRVMRVNSMCVIVK